MAGTENQGKVGIEVLAYLSDVTMNFGKMMDGSGTLNWNGLDNWCNWTGQTYWVWILDELQLGRILDLYWKMVVVCKYIVGLATRDGLSPFYLMAGTGRSHLSPTQKHAWFLNLFPFE